MRDVIMSLLAKEPAHGYELRQRLVKALGPAGGALNPGQGACPVSSVPGWSRRWRSPSRAIRTKKVYELTAAGRERVHRWLADVTWSKVAPVEFHLKLVVAAATRLADPVALVDAQRLELLRELHQLQELALEEPADADGALLLEGASLRLQADIRWLEGCERRWVEKGIRR